MVGREGRGVPSSPSRAVQLFPASEIFINNHTSITKSYCLLQCDKMLSRKNHRKIEFRMKVFGNFEYFLCLQHFPVYVNKLWEIKLLLEQLFLFYRVLLHDGKTPSKISSYQLGIFSKANLETTRYDGTKYSKKDQPKFAEHNF